MSPFGEDDQIDGDLTPGSTPRDLQFHIDNPLHETLRSGEKVRVSGDGDVTEFMSKLPGGNWAVFSGDATPLGQGKSFGEVHAIEMSPRQQGGGGGGGKRRCRGRGFGLPKGAYDGTVEIF